MITDLRTLNLYCRLPSFKQKNIRCVKDVIQFADNIACFRWWLYFCSNQVIVIDHVDQLLYTLIHLRWPINYAKSFINASPVKVFLGNRINSLGPKGCPEIAITAERVRKLKRSLRRILQLHTVDALTLASMGGQCVAISRVILPAKLLLRSVYHVLNQSTQWRSMLSLDQGAYKELE